MDKSQQTEKVLLELYHYTKMFTKALQPLYYYQFRGDVDDLASEFFCHFITPKGRKGCVKESLLDKFDCKITSLPYLVKVSVTRKLIDQSRQHPNIISSLDLMLENGDSPLFISEGESSLEDPKFRKQVVSEYDKLEDCDKNKFFVEIYDSMSPLRLELKPSFIYIHQCPVQQITDKTAVLYVRELNQLVNFSIEDGHARGSLHPFNLSEDEMKEVQKLIPYHSYFTRDLFYEYFNEIRGSGIY